MHGGPSGFDSKEWTPLLDPSEATLFSKAEVDTITSTMPVGSAIIFSRISEDGEEGFPGRLLVEVLVGLVQPSGPQTQRESLNLGSVVLVYRAKLLDEGKVTPINLTQVGFSLAPPYNPCLSYLYNLLSIGGSTLTPQSRTTMSTRAISQKHPDHMWSPSRITS